MKEGLEILNSKLLIYNKEDGRLKNLEATLRSHFTEVVAVSDYSKFLDELNKSPNIIIVHLYNDDAKSILSSIRNILEFIPIIALADESDIKLVYPLILEFDVNRFLIEPVDESMLFNCIRKSIFRFSKQEQDIETHKQFITELLDMSRDLLIITDGKRITHVNKSFLEYSRCSTVKEFKERYPELAGLLINYDGAFYKGKSFDEWIDIMLADNLVQDYEKKKNIMKLKNLNMPAEPSTFILDINRFESSNDILLTLNDITDFENEKTYYKEIAQYDALTSIYNRKKFNEELIKNMETMLKLGIKVALVIFDIDHFKKINDKYGHGTGDNILKEIVSIVKNSIRKADIFSRFGGEEFTIIMPDTNIREATDTAERIRRSFEMHKFAEVDKVTCSFGVTCMQPSDTSETFIDRADKALYNAKNSGRNKVISIN